MAALCAGQLTLAMLHSFRVDMLIEKEQFAEQKRHILEKNVNPPTGERESNPVYLPAPHEVAKALYTSFVTPPVRRSEARWFHQSIGHSILDNFSASYTLLARRAAGGSVWCV